MTALKNSFQRISRKLTSMVSSVKDIRTRGTDKKEKPSQRENRYYT